MREVKKPWGKELWIAYDNGRYAGKILTIKRGERLSLQYHKKKHETIFVLSGILKLTVGKSQKELRSKRLQRGESFAIPPRLLHRMEGVTNCRIAEFSSPELEDVVRLEDDYGR